MFIFHLAGPYVAQPGRAGTTQDTFAAMMLTHAHTLRKVPLNTWPHYLSLKMQAILELFSLHRHFEFGELLPWFSLNLHSMKDLNISQIMVQPSNPLKLLLFNCHISKCLDTDTLLNLLGFRTTHVSWWTPQDPKCICKNVVVCCIFISPYHSWISNSFIILSVIITSIHLIPFSTNKHKQLDGF